VLTGCGISGLFKPGTYCLPVNSLIYSLIAAMRNFFTFSEISKAISSRKVQKANRANEAWLSDSPHARTLATALMQSAYNIANALGAFAGGLGLMAAGNNIHLGLISTIWIGAAFALGGLAIFGFSWHLDNKEKQQA